MQSIADLSLSGSATPHALSPYQFRRSSHPPTFCSSASTRPTTLYYIRRFQKYLRRRFGQHQGILNFTSAAWNFRRHPSVSSGSQLFPSPSEQLAPQAEKHTLRHHNGDKINSVESQWYGERPPVCCQRTSPKGEHFPVRPKLDRYLHTSIHVVDMSKHSILIFCRLRSCFPRHHLPLLHATPPPPMLLPV